MTKNQFINKINCLKQDNGKPYTKKTIYSYTRVLFWNKLRSGSKKESLWFLCIGYLRNIDSDSCCYGDLTKQQLEKIFDFMRCNPLASLLDKQISDKTTSNAINLLISIS